MSRRVTLRQCVYQYIDESNQSSAEFDRLAGIAYRGMEALGMDISWQPKTVLLEVAANQTARLPGDYLNWTKIGVHNDHQELCTFVVNRHLSRLGAASDTRLEDLKEGALTPGLMAGSSVFMGYEDGYIATDGDRIYGDCSIDERAGVILLPADSGYPYIVLEYISSPECDEQFSIDLYLREALIAWLRWKDIVSRRNIPENKIQARKQDFYNEQRLAKRRLNPLRLQEISNEKRVMRTPVARQPAPAPLVQTKGLYQSLYQNLYQ